MKEEIYDVLEQFFLSAIILSEEQCHAEWFLLRMFSLTGSSAFYILRHLLKGDSTSISSLPFENEYQVCIYCL